MNSATGDAFTPLRKNLLTICVMMATIMQALDTTIANVAMPYMQGSLSTTQDQINWVLTSYIVAAAVMTSPLAWMAARFGRKNLFIVCVVGFTVASMLCGAALTLEQMVLYRLLQGAFGAALVPLSQAVLLDLNPREKHGQAMAVWGMGVMLGPIMGPSLGAWLTEYHSWRWVFFVNLPFGALTTIGFYALLKDIQPPRPVPFAWFGFLSLSIGIGALQLMLDRGQELGWFDSREIIIEAVLSASGFYFFMVDAFTGKYPFVAMDIFKDWNFSVSLVLMFIVGIILLATLALATPFLQNLLGYPILDSGFLLGARGLGTLFSMMMVGRLSGRFDGRIFVALGLTLTTLALYQMINWTPDVKATSIALTSIMQGAGLGLVFVPLNTIAFATLPVARRTEGAALWTLLRNIGSSAGISIVIAHLINDTSKFHSQLAEFINPFNEALQMPNAAGLTLPQIELTLTHQAAIMAYRSDFLLMTLISFAAFPLLGLLRKSGRAAPVDAVAME